MILKHVFRGGRDFNASERHAIKSSKAHVVKKPVTLPKLKFLDDDKSNKGAKNEKP